MSERSEYRRVAAKKATNKVVKKVAYGCLGSVLSLPVLLVLLIVVIAAAAFSGGSSDTPDGSDVVASQSGFIQPIGGVMTERYGNVENPFGPGGRFHAGMDIGCNKDDPIRAAADGMVDRADSGGFYNGGWGNYIIIGHGNNLKTGYAHLNTVGVTLGQQVKQGQVIGYCGTTGASTAPHLHIEVYSNGTRIDPEPYFPKYERSSIVSP
ncbi:M23 family metallopeptidase [Culicoidibacter larvae]|uniref:M23 family metallopeptidase n=1 Tax=Culicoidibacter larvae TaxID=2579976 RepID=A0A5R8QH40_9FIRM|nr:M23 family metallopeptidase [Culicoidibacter larvae]TLG77345.1 M23 family metallopeptidase [Culicoidibacter larvae]